MASMGVDFPESASPRYRGKSSLGTSKREWGCDMITSSNWKDFLEQIKCRVKMSADFPRWLMASGRRHALPRPFHGLLSGKGGYFGLCFGFGIFISYLGRVFCDGSWLCIIVGRKEKYGGFFVTWANDHNNNGLLHVFWVEK